MVTGAAGRIGSYFATHAAGKYELVLMDRPDCEQLEELAEHGRLVHGDLADLEALKRSFEGVDTVVHLAADPSPAATWDSVVANNITGTYHVFVAAKAAGCRRVVVASSIHAVSGYPADVQVKPSDPVNPGDLYGVSKCFAEALARYMAEQEGVSSICIRIGAFQPLDRARTEAGLRMLDAFVSRRDLNQLIHRCIDAEQVRFAIVHGLSDNRFKRLDLSETRQLLGYEPEDDATVENPQLAALDLNETVASHSRSGGQRSGLRNEL
jgi:nucleoside-diphosphate-sugar epimerase